MKFYIVLLLCVTLIRVKSTDLAAVYKQGILLLHNADSIPSHNHTPINPDNVWMKISDELVFPVGLSHDPFSGALYVAELSDMHTDIFSLKLDENGTAMVQSQVSKLGTSRIESVTYDPDLHRLLWSDSQKHGIYYADILNQPSSDHSDKYSNTGIDPTLFYDKGVDKPRGVTMDYCGRSLYWTERHNKNGVIKGYNFTDDSVSVIVEGKTGVYFQSVEYDGSNGNLLWAETTSSDEKSNSSCSIISRNIQAKSSKIVVKFDNCYPFSLTSDADYIYWTDWARAGLMRISKTDTKDLVKLVDTPRIVMEKTGTHYAFGLVNLNKGPPEAMCGGRYSHKTPTQKLKKYVTKEYVAPTTAPIMDTEETDTKSSNNVDSMWGSVSSSASRITMSPKTYHHLHLVIVILAVTSIFFMATTLLLFTNTLFSQRKHIESLRGFLGSINRFSVPSIPVSSVIVSSPGGKPGTKPAKRPKRFGSRTRDTPLPTCHGNDGVYIEIEDCCQMTLCDTPCYTTIKKEGKGYTSSACKWDDKERLLEDSDLS